MNFICPILFFFAAAVPTYAHGAGLYDFPVLPSAETFATSGMSQDQVDLIVVTELSWSGFGINRNPFLSAGGARNAVPTQYSGSFGTIAAKRYVDHWRVTFDPLLFPHTTVSGFDYGLLTRFVKLDGTHVGYFQAMNLDELAMIGSELASNLAIGCQDQLRAKISGR